MANKLLEDTKEQRISHCRYYKGEEECPYKHGIDATRDERCTFWVYEEYYAKGFDNLDGEYADYKHQGGGEFCGYSGKTIIYDGVFLFQIRRGL